MVGKLRFRMTAPAGAFERAMQRNQGIMAKAAQGAMNQAATNIKREGRADIKGAGFSNRFANSFRANVYPKGGQASVGAAALIFDTIKYADIFETGGSVHGKPMLWLPLPTAPKRIGRQRMTPALYIRQIGPLFTINREGKPPLLAANIGISARQRASGSVGKITNARLRKGAAGGGPKQVVPLFVGVDDVTLKKRFNLRRITAANAAKLGQYFAENLKDE
ncbi:DUF6441 family protein [Mesorhizobium sp. B1-1-7]|uniref:DUF6441 family protein n=1 Tax=Mesorhizobium sp. B1-1-7 TaxID=2589977 RepID=UPI001127F117|nr:DUF6441 family protein [Mesorhizobium sp. B1-1-7]TPN53991.1 hypothetical protein FJ978_07765 [Mesorhizobium sp. B1-1-7]